MKLPLIIFATQPTTTTYLELLKSAALQYWPEADIHLVPHQVQFECSPQLQLLINWAQSQVSVIKDTAARAEIELKETSPGLLGWLLIAAVATEQKLSGAYFLASNDLNDLHCIGRHYLSHGTESDIGILDEQDCRAGFFAHTEHARKFVQFIFRTLISETFLRIAALSKDPQSIKWALHQECSPFSDQLLLQCFIQNEYLCTSTLTAEQPSSTASLRPRENPRTIFFVHKGHSEYLQWAVAAARYSNPSSPIKVISDHNYSDSADRVEAIPLQQFWKGAQEFEQHYMHASPYGQDFELFCFQRWFVLKDYLEHTPTSRFLHLDSDVILVRQLNEISNLFDTADFTLSHKNCGHCAFFNSVAPLNNFCDFLIRMFSEGKFLLTKRTLLDEFLLKVKLKTEMQPINDMLLLQLFADHNKTWNIGDSTAVVENSTFDHAVGLSQGAYEMENEAKKVQWDNGAAWGFHQGLGQKVRFNAMHFQGGVRARMKQFFDDYLAQSKSNIGRGSRL